MGQLLNAADFRHAAQRRLPRGLFEYIDRGAEDELALSNLRRSLDAIRLSPRVLTGHPERDLRVRVMEREIAMPVVVAPTALAGLVAYDGEAKLARAAARQGVPFCISTQSITTIEEVRAGAPDADLWFQLYLWKDRELTRKLLDRVWACNVTTLVVTADTPIGPKREYNQRNGFSIPFIYSLRAALDVAMRPRWLAGVLLRYLHTTGMPTYGHYPEEFRSAITRPSIVEAVKLENLLNWDDLRILRQQWKGRLIVKGILHPQDAREAADLGADGIVISAHGGRNLDIAPVPAEVLPDIADAVGNRLEILADSGVRRGSDVLKYISLGAQAVMLGRLPLWGLAAGDEKGADQMLAMIRTEIDMTLTMLGVRRPEDCRGLPIRSTWI
ncbi:alpha-hydroxy-acid oxidizing protein [Microvirga terrae]|uniref:Alpha-hydroxy-acid oxidizing protein n=1 Tax=Microvirga terrae TaxID=2740529 RepID=A0ABY5RTV0_9HYPH|nr:alpha-hydroxy acid oxidase [Microvirga terrae]UVF20681.1 alpha-hydroxy-acid oxidizing protein [Microvirga terrae]